MSLVVDRLHDPHATVALVDVLRDRVLAALCSGATARGVRLPSVREVAERFAVSRREVASAFRQLACDGVLVVSARSGAYVHHDELEPCECEPYAREPHVRKPDASARRVVSNDSWVLDLFVQGLDQGIAPARLPARLAERLARRPVRVAVLERVGDHLWSICDELRRDFDVVATPVDLDALGSAWCEQVDELSPAVREADLLISTPFLGAQARRLAARLGKPVCVTVPCPALYAHARRDLLRGPVHVVIGDPRFRERLRTILSAPASLDAALSPLPRGDRVPLTIYECDDVGRIPSHAVVYVTRLARHRLRYSASAQPLLSRSEPETRTLSHDAARSVLRVMLDVRRAAARAW